jgi:hypothetical protein
MGGWRGKGGTGVAELSRRAREVEEEAGEENEGETTTVAIAQGRRPSADNLHSRMTQVDNFIFPNNFPTRHVWALCGRSPQVYSGNKS